MDAIRDLEIARAEARGTLLGTVDCVILAMDHPKVFDMVDSLNRLRAAREEYNKASRDLLDARLAK